MTDDADSRSLKEGRSATPLWLTLDQALASRPTFAVEHIIDQYSDRLQHAVGRTPGEGL